MAEDFAAELLVVIVIFQGITIHASKVFAILSHLYHLSDDDLAWTCGTPVPWHAVMICIA